MWAAGKDEAAWKCLCAQVSAPADRCLIVPKRHSQGEGKDRSELPERFSNRTCICRFRLSVLCDKCNLISRSCAAAVLEILFCLFTRPPHPCSSGHDSPFCGALVQLAWKCLCAQVSAPADRCLIVPKRHSQGEGKDRSELPERFSNRTCICLCLFLKRALTRLILPLLFSQWLLEGGGRNLYSAGRAYTGSHERYLRGACGSCRLPLTQVNQAKIVFKHGQHAVCSLTLLDFCVL